jgi:ABC-type nitrate/sulfonate/bicarbonate transport system substrate-binding protein
MKPIELSSLLGIIIAAALTAPARGAEPPVIRIGWSVPAQTQHYVMMKKPDLLKNLGHSYRIEWINFPASVAIIQALASKNLDAGGVSIIPVARTIEQKAANLRIVADIASERPGGFQTTWVTLESTGIKSVADLRGKTMGVASYGSTTDLLGRAILKRNGIDPDRDVKRIDVRFPVMEQALRKGDIVAGEMAQPFFTAAKARGGIRVLFTAQEILPVLPLLVEVFTDEFITKNPDAVKGFLEDYVAALDYSRDPKNRDAVIDMVADVTKLPREVWASFLLTPMDYAMAADGLPDPEAIQKTFDFLTDAGFLKTKLDAATAVDLRYHPRAKR